ncbi:MAG: HAMP domain-containing sensor histidine kinase [Rhizonema sp. PD37]|nr:HAMP domain-containing sensor histidine kinase [Rhizonema sp. PD37]
MKDFSHLLSNKTQTIIAQWLEAVRLDKKISSAKNLSRTAIEDHIDYILTAMVTVLSQFKESEIKPIVEASLTHGTLRANQGFDAEEIAREYSLLRNVIFDILEQELLDASSKEVLRAVRLIDLVLDEAIAHCFKSYTEQRLAELQHLQKHLSLNNQELTRLVRANQDNISFFAHELKNPLTSIIGYSDLFLRIQKQKTEEKDSYKNLEHIERVLCNGRKLLRLINDLLEISRYDAGEMKLHPEPLDLCEVIYDVYEVLESLTGEKDLQVVIDCDRTSKQVVTDSLRFQQIVTNLLSNAIRYTKSGTVKVKCEILDDNKWAIVVSDTGVGISPEDREQIFEPYFRVGLSQKSYLPDSTGLGLAIVLRLVKLLQGEIDLVSQEGVGSTFTVTFPLEVVPEN